MNFEELSSNNSSHKIHNYNRQQTPIEESLWELLIVLKTLPTLRTGTIVRSIAQKYALK
jgi:hypothetical protein